MLRNMRYVGVAIVAGLVIYLSIVAVCLVAAISG